MTTYMNIFEIPNNLLTTKHETKCTGTDEVSLIL